MIHTEVRMIANGLFLLLGLEIAGWRTGLLLSLDQGLPIFWASIPAMVEREALSCAALILFVASSG